MLRPPLSARRQCRTRFAVEPPQAAVRYPMPYPSAARESRSVRTPRRPCCGRRGEDKIHGRLQRVDRTGSKRQRQRRSVRSGCDSNLRLGEVQCQQRQRFHRTGHVEQLRIGVDVSATDMKSILALLYQPKETPDACLKRGANLSQRACENTTLSQST